MRKAARTEAAQRDDESRSFRVTSMSKPGLSSSFVACTVVLGCSSRQGIRGGRTTDSSRLARAMHCVSWHRRVGAAAHGYQGAGSASVPQVVLDRDRIGERCKDASAAARRRRSEIPVCRDDHAHAVSVMLKVSSRCCGHARHDVAIGWYTLWAAPPEGADHAVMAMYRRLEGGVAHVCGVPGPPKLIIERHGQAEYISRYGTRLYRTSVVIHTRR